MNAALGKADLAGQYASQHSDLIKVFHTAWIEPYDTIANVTQTALALALSFDIYTGSTALCKHPTTWLRLTPINATADFYKMLLSTRIPSRLYQVVMGGTTTWERWDSLLPDGSVNPGRMTSFNHYAFGSVADWVHQKVGVLAPGEPGWKVVRVAPELGGNITWAKAAYLGPYWWVNSSWTVQEDGFHLEVNVPPDSKAQVKLPGKEELEIVGSGRKEFFVEGFKISERPLMIRKRSYTVAYFK